MNHSIKLSLDKFNYPKLPRVEKNGTRFYKDPEDYLLPSVTTILDACKSEDTKVALDEWRQRIGHSEAQRITDESAYTGSCMHDSLENYILYNTPPHGNVMSKMMTKTIIDKGLSKVDEVYGCEVPLYFPAVYAGTTDLVGVHQGEDAIMDYKNSRQMRVEEHIESYFFQLVAYGEAHNAMQGTNITKGVIMMATQQGKYQEFIISGSKYAHYKNLWFDMLYEYFK